MSGFYWPIATHNVKNLNKHAVLDLIRFSSDGISRAQLAQKMDLSRAAMTAIVNDLLESQVIQETEARSKLSGRPPIILEINPNRGYVVGIDLGASHFSIAIANFTSQIIDETETPFDISLGPEKTLKAIDNTLKEHLHLNNITLAQINAVGMGVPGPISSEAGTVIAPPIMPGWDGFPIRSTLETMWNCPVSLNNDAELGALGEWAFGVGRGEDYLAYIKVGTGIGAGLFLNSQIYRGSTGSAGEIGHLTVDENGPACECGNTGCLEAMAGGRAIARQGQDAILKGQATLLSTMGPPENLTARDVASAARRGDFVAQQIISKAGSTLGIAIAGMVNLLNPHMIVIGGGVSEIGDLFLQPIRDAVERRSLPASVRNVKINSAVLHRRSSILGAVVQALSIAIHAVSEKEVM